MSQSGPGSPTVFATLISLAPWRAPGATLPCSMVRSCGRAPVQPARVQAPTHRNSRGSPSLPAARFPRQRLADRQVAWVIPKPQPGRRGPARPKKGHDSRATGQPAPIWHAHRAGSPKSRAPSAAPPHVPKRSRRSCAATRTCPSHRAHAEPSPTPAPIFPSLPDSSFQAGRGQGRLNRHSYHCMYGGASGCRAGSAAAGKGRCRTGWSWPLRWTRSSNALKRRPHQAVGAWGMAWRQPARTVRAPHSTWPLPRCIRSLSRSAAQRLPGRSVSRIYLSRGGRRMRPGRGTTIAVTIPKAR
jgi:hypothetical protein